MVDTKEFRKMLVPQVISKMEKGHRYWVDNRGNLWETDMNHPGFKVWQKERLERKEKEKQQKEQKAMERKKKRAENIKKKLEKLQSQAKEMGLVV